MKTIFLDKEFRCHINNGENIICSIDTDAFDDKCNAYIEGYRFVPYGKSWTREDNNVFHGEMIAPWKEYFELDEIQKEYEKQQLNEYKQSLLELGVEL